VIVSFLVVPSASARCFAQSIRLFKRMGAVYDARCVEAEMGAGRAALAAPMP